MGWTELLGKGGHLQLLEYPFPALGSFPHYWMLDSNLYQATSYGISRCLCGLWLFLRLVHPASFCAPDRLILSYHKNSCIYASHHWQSNSGYSSRIFRFCISRSLPLLGLWALQEHFPFHVYVLCGYEWRLAVWHLLRHHKFPILVRHGVPDDLYLLWHCDCAEHLLHHDWARLPRNQVC